MTLDDVVEAARLLLDDTVLPYLWSNAELETFAEHSYLDAVVRNGGTLTSIDFNISIKAGVSEYDVDPDVTQILRTKLSSEAKPLIRETTSRLDHDFYNWQETTGIPKRYIESLNRHSIRLFPIPESDDTLIVTATKIPGNITSEKEMEMLPVRRQYGVAYLVCKMAYLKNDADTINEQKSSYFGQLATKYFGQEKSNSDQEFERDFTQKKIIPQYFA